MERDKALTCNPNGVAKKAISSQDLGLECRETVLHVASKIVPHTELDQNGHHIAYQVPTIPQKLAVY